jgi:hypothetical protein
MPIVYRDHVIRPSSVCDRTGIPLVIEGPTTGVLAHLSDRFLLGADSEEQARRVIDEAHDDPVGHLGLVETLLQAGYEDAAARANRLTRFEREPLV